MKWNEFINKYPNYSRFRFSFNSDKNVVFLFNGDEYNPFNADGSLKKILYHFPNDSWPAENIHNFLNTNDKDEYEKTIETGFPKELQLSKAIYTVYSNDKPLDINLTEIDIYATPSEKFITKIRDIFGASQIKHTDSTEANKWLNGSDMSYWPQQLNFASWCATSGCGIGIDLLKSIKNNQIKSVLTFHILFTIRRILSQMNCPLPGDKFFKQIDNNYNKNSYAKLCKEFNISTTSDFRYLHEANNGLGIIYKKMLNGKTYQMLDIYDKKMNGLDTTIWPDGYFYFKNESGSWGDKYFDFIQPKEKHPYLYFMLNQSKGLTIPGLSRLNQSIEAYVYCILGSQVNTRSSIIGNSGSAQETQNVFLQLFESSVIENDISKSIQRYQFSLQQAKQKLDLAVAIDCWLLPSYLILNTSSINGYNNKLQRATNFMKLGVNNINSELIPSVKHNLPPSKKKIEKPVEKNKPEEKPETPVKKIKKHEDNKTAVIIIVAGAAWFLFR